MWAPQNLTIANFGHPVPKSWAGHCKDSKIFENHLNPLMSIHVPGISYFCFLHYLVMDKWPNKPLAGLVFQSKFWNYLKFKQENKYLSKIYDNYI